MKNVKALALIAAALLAAGSASAEVKSTAGDMGGAAGTSAASKPIAEGGAGAGGFKQFKVYTDANSPDNHYAPSGWMGDWGDLKVNVADFEDPHSGATAIRIDYSGKKTQGANWAGVYWQNPPNNWGSRPGGYDLTGAKKLVFWAKGAKGGEVIHEVRIGGISGEYPDSDVAGFGPVKLTTEWQKFEVDLSDKDLSSISGGFMWSANTDANPNGFTIYLDDIAFE